MCKAGKAVINRIKEPSTMAGLAAVGLMFGVPAEATNAVVQVGVSIAGALAVLMPEKTLEK